MSRTSGSKGSRTRKRMHRDESYSPASSLDSVELRRGRRSFVAGVGPGTRSDVNDGDARSSTSGAAGSGGSGGSGGGKSGGSNAASRSVSEKKARKKLRKAKLAKVLGELLVTMMKVDGDGVFWHPVDPALAPRYDEIISKPMDFSTMRKKLVKGSYASLHHFELDFRLIVANCIKYNEEGSYYHKAALRLEARLAKPLLLAQMRLAIPHIDVLSNELVMWRREVESRYGEFTKAELDDVRAILEAEANGGDPAGGAGGRNTASGGGGGTALAPAHGGDARYTGELDTNKPIKCALCRLTVETDVTGPFLNPPFVAPGKAKYLYVHLNCARFGAPETLYDEPSDTWFNLIKAVSRGRFIKCALSDCPSGKGATLGCTTTTCQRSYHLPCSGKDAAFFEDGGVFFCPTHEAKVKAKAPADDKEAEAKAKAAAAKAAAASVARSGSILHIPKGPLSYGEQPSKPDGLDEKIRKATAVHRMFLEPGKITGVSKAGELICPTAELDEAGFVDAIGSKVASNTSYRWLGTVDVVDFGARLSVIDTRNNLGGRIKYFNRHQRKPRGPYRKRNRASASSGSVAPAPPSRSSNHAARTRRNHERRVINALLAVTHPSNPAAQAARAAAAKAAADGRARLPIVEPNSLHPRPATHYVTSRTVSTPPVAIYDTPVMFHAEATSLGPTYDSTHASLGASDSVSVIAPGPVAPGGLARLEAAVTDMVTNKRARAPEAGGDDLAPPPAKKARTLDAALDDLAALGNLGFDTSFVDALRSGDAAADGNKFVHSAALSSDELARKLAENSAFVSYMASMPWVRESTVPSPWEIEAASRLLANFADLAPEVIKPAELFPPPK
ncbi:bromodomain adjacent to zinc finger domain-containing protein 2B [Thecamonas trahens ATCC 50062]|uniref:Bromodomain adjacent to zinc finger domain-containing protein 2B n=1 Tax=Thecamonas trahens ATCC 50062 TaxID=461836 RepID=A0A0L0DLJ8_THETB|nr:bromodomain adjacent to zinc finger domain-containing protein 2B [Thecamonas trahens ATCC 50062]KNC52921.1 bromodomain adjacent to zinc finger domain-containing protein 2B [Thecamonas trahens ATCC 50062]|eukprot:XP_013754817.1 bromodomain adjacent to zinc finger domain-containing protein 2B [Thecamonas trahens ATCC 50062]